MQSMSSTVPACVVCFDPSPDLSPPFPHKGGETHWVCSSCWKNWKTECGKKTQPSTCPICRVEDDSVSTNRRLNALAALIVSFSAIHMSPSLASFSITGASLWIGRQPGANLRETGFGTGIVAAIVALICERGPRNAALFFLSPIAICELVKRFNSQEQLPAPTNNLRV